MNSKRACRKLPEELSSGTVSLALLALSLGRDPLYGFR